MSQNRQFTEVAGGSNNQTWKPQANEKNGMAYDPNGNNTIEGYFSGEREVTSGEKPFTVANIQLVNPDGTLGEEIDVIADTVLKDRLSKIPMNAYVRLTYLGRMHKKGINTSFPWSQTNSYHNWWVGEDKGAIPLHTLTGRPAPTANTGQQNFGQPAQNGQQNQGFNPNANQFGGQQQNNQQAGQGQGFQPNFGGNQQQGNQQFQGAPAQNGQQQFGGQPVFQGGNPNPQFNNQAPAGNGQGFNPNGNNSAPVQNVEQKPYVAPVANTQAPAPQFGQPGYVQAVQGQGQNFQPGQQGAPAQNGQQQFQGNPQNGQPAQGGNPNNVFGGPQMGNGNDDLPF